MTASETETVPDNSARIAEIDAILASGVTQTVTDGITTVLDLDRLERERNRLARTDTNKRKQRPFFRRLRLDGFKG